MLNRPIYHDLLQYGITSLQLDDFIKELKFGENESSTEPVTALSEIDLPVYIGTQHYSNALCYATALKQIDIVNAFLKLGAQSDVATTAMRGGSALFLVMQPSTWSYEIFSLLLKTPVDIFFMDSLGLTAFEATIGNTKLIHELLEADSDIAECSLEKKNTIASTISYSMMHYECDKSKRARKINLALYESLKEIYPAYLEKDAVKDTVSQICGFTSGQPLGGIVLSYLFKPYSGFSRIIQNVQDNSRPKRLRYESNEPNDELQSSNSKMKQ